MNKIVGQNRRSVRLKGYDYAQSGAYFVTICTHGRRCTLGEIVDGEMRLSEIGGVVRDEWLKTLKIRQSVELGEFVIMPNHVHGILILGDTGRGTSRRAPTEQFGKPTSNSLPTIIRGFKSAATKRINDLRKMPGIPVWQRNFYEHVIRNDHEFNRISEYIRCNPLNWPNDEENIKKINAQ